MGSGEQSYGAAAPLIVAKSADRAAAKGRGSVTGAAAAAELPGWPAASLSCGSNALPLSGSLESALQSPTQ